VSLRAGRQQKGNRQVNGLEELPGIDPSKAHVARMYDYYLGGINNFEADRIACMALDKIVPGTRGLAINNRNYLARVVHVLAGITASGNSSTSGPACPRKITCIKSPGGCIPIRESSTSTATR
jgi:S-adenosyl methyltransferase